MTVISQIVGNERHTSIAVNTLGLVLADDTVVERGPGLEVEDSVFIVSFGLFIASAGTTI